MSATSKTVVIPQLFSLLVSCIFELSLAVSLMFLTNCPADFKHCQVLSSGYLG